MYNVLGGRKFARGFSGFIVGLFEGEVGVFILLDIGKVIVIFTLRSF